jgi:hypothetical protein
MRKAPKRLGLGAALVLAAGGLLGMATSTPASAAPRVTTPEACHLPPSVVVGLKHFAGLVPALGNICSNTAPPPFVGTPPLLFHGGDVMSTRETGPLVIVPIFWHAPGFSFVPGYEQLIQTYIHDVSAASFQTSNVYSVLNEYYGRNGSVRYLFLAGQTIDDTNALPANGCTVENVDKSLIYADGTGYKACLDDAQLQAEIASVTAARGLPHNLNHIYVLFLPKKVESCFNPGSSASTAGGQACTINYEPTAAYCAYHNIGSDNATIYANMPYPIYHSPVHLTCGSDARRAGFGAVQSPNGNPDADVEISPTSHEVAEAVTDPDTTTGWFDSSGFEIGDDCAYIYGPVHGSPGAFYNQVINGDVYLTQEEFSNFEFFLTGGTAGCSQGSSVGLFP